MIPILDTNIVSKMSKFSAYTKLCHKARDSDDLTGLQKVTNKLIMWANKWKINFNVDTCSVMHIGRTNMQGSYNMSN